MSIFICFALFLLAMIACMVTGVDMTFALVLGIVLFGIIALRRGYTVCEIWQMMWCEGRKLVSVLGVFLCIGAITALWRSCGTIAYFIYHGVQIITPPVFVLVAFLLTCLLSYALGTSFGVVGTAGIILMALARSGGINELLTAGAVMSGAYFGDRCSPASSSALLVAAVTETKLYDNLRNMRLSGWLPLGVTTAVYAVLSVCNPIQTVDETLLAALCEHFSISLWTLLPAVLMLVLPLLRVPIRTTLLLSSLAAFAVSVLVQGMGVGETLRAAILGYEVESGMLREILSGGGAISMLKSSVMVMCTGLFAGLLTGAGAMDVMKGKVKLAARKWGLFGAATAVSIVAGAVFCNQSILCMMGYPLLRESYAVRGASKEEMALDMENSGVVLAALIPWNIACSIPHQMLGVGAGTVLYTVLLYMIPLCYAVTKKRLMKKLVLGERVSIHD